MQWINKHGIVIEKFSMFQLQKYDCVFEIELENEGSVSLVTRPLCVRGSLG